MSLGDLGNLIVVGDVVYMPFWYRSWHTNVELPVYTYNRLTVRGGTSEDRAAAVKALGGNLQSPVRFAAVLPPPPLHERRAMYPPPPPSCFQRVLSWFPSIVAWAEQRWPTPHYDPIQTWMKEHWNTRSDALLSRQLSSEELADEASNGDGAADQSESEISFIFLTEGLTAPLPILLELAKRVPSVQWQLESESGIERIDALISAGQLMRVVELHDAGDGAVSNRLERFRRRIHFDVPITQRIRTFARVSRYDAYLRQQTPSCVDFWICLARVESARSWWKARAVLEDIRLRLDGSDDTDQELGPLHWQRRCALPEAQLPLPEKHQLKETYGRHHRSFTDHLLTTPLRALRLLDQVQRNYHAAEINNSETESLLIRQGPRLNRQQ